MPLCTHFNPTQLLVLGSFLLWKNMPRFNQYPIQSCLKSANTLRNITHFVKSKQAQTKCFKALRLIDSPWNAHSNLQSMIFEFIHHCRIILANRAVVHQNTWSFKTYCCNIQMILNQKINGKVNNSTKTRDSTLTWSCHGRQAS